MNRSHDLTGRRAIVTGAAQGLGRAYAVALAEAGALVAVCDVKPEVHELAAAGTTAFAATADVSVTEQAKGFVDDAAEALGGLDLVINNAAVVDLSHPARDSFEQAVAVFDEVANINYRGTFLVGRAAIPHVIAAGGGDIVNVTTDHIHTCGYPDAHNHADAPDCPYAGVRRPALGGPLFDVYDSSKWAVKGLTNVWSHALLRHGVRVNSFGMGATDTPMYRKYVGDRALPPGVMTPESVAAVLLDLLAEGPGGRTGDCIQLWAGHPTVLPPPGVDALLARQ